MPSTGELTQLQARSAERRAARASRLAAPAAPDPPRRSDGGPGPRAPRPATPRGLVSALASAARPLFRTVPPAFWARLPGLRARLVRVAIALIDRGGAAGAAAPDGLALDPSPAAPAWPAPLFSVLLPAGRLTAPEQAAALDWLSRQTLPSFEALEWDADAGTCCPAGRPDEAWSLDGGDPWGTLLGRYVLVASPATRGLPPGFLEANALALEGEGLDWALNVTGTAGEALASLDRGRFPGRELSERAQAMARAEALDSRLEIVVPGPSAGHPRVVGKVLLHGVEPVPGFPAPSAWTGGLPPGLSVQGRHLAAGERLEGPARRPRLRIGGIALDRPCGRPAAGPTVLALLPGFDQDGMVRGLAEALGALGGDVGLVVASLEPGDPGRGGRPFRALTPRVFDLPGLVCRPQTGASLAALVAGHRVDVLLAVDGPVWADGILTDLARQFPRLRLVLQVGSRRGGAWGRPRLGDLRRIAGIVVEDPALVPLCAARGADASLVHVLPPAVDPAAFDPAAFDARRRAEVRRGLGVSPHQPLVVSAAPIEPEERPLDVLCLARQFFPEEASFLLVGSGSCAADVDAEIERMRLANVGRREPPDSPAELLAAADVLVITSERAVLPRALLEAQALGRPVVATDVGRVREVLEATGGGEVCRPADPAGLARAVRRTLASPPDPGRVRERVRERFPARHAASVYARVLLGR